MLKPPGSGHKALHMHRTHSGDVLLNGGGGSGNPSYVSPRALSPPAGMLGMDLGGGRSSSQDLRSKNLSPPPPTTRPPPLPMHTKRPPGPPTHVTVTTNTAPSRWSGASYRSTDSASSEDSLTTDLPRHPRQHGGVYNSSEQQDQPQYFPRAYTSPALFGGVAIQQQERVKSHPANNRPVKGGHPDSSSHPLDSIVKNAYNSSNLAVGPAGNGGGPNSTQQQQQQQVSRKASWQGKPVDYSNASHPLQMSVSRGHSQSIGSSLASHPWGHSAQHNLPHKPHQQQKR